MFASFLILGLLGSAISAPPSPRTVTPNSQTSTVKTEVPRSRPIRLIQGSVPTVRENCASLPDVRVINLSCPQTAALVAKLKQAQAKLGKGDQLYFELLSGALASSPMTKASPRDVFMNIDYSKAGAIERVRNENRLWQPYKFSYASGSHGYGPSGFVEFYWDIEVVLGFTGEILRVQMIAKPPLPF